MQCCWIFRCYLISCTVKTACKTAVPKGQSCRFSLFQESKPPHLQLTQVHA